MSRCAPNPVPSELNARPTHVLLSAEARARGFKNTLAFRRWCRRTGVPVTKTGKLEWVATLDVDQAIAGVAGAPSDHAEQASVTVDSAAARMMELH